MEKIINILGFAGSLRKGSYNRSLLRAALELVPKGANIEIFDLEGIPPFNQAFENQLRKKLRNSRQESGRPMPFSSLRQNITTPYRAF